MVKKSAVSVVSRVPCCVLLIHPAPQDGDPVPSLEHLSPILELLHFSPIQFPQCQDTLLQPSLCHTLHHPYPHHTLIIPTTFTDTSTSSFCDFCLYLYLCLCELCDGSVACTAICKEHILFEEPHTLLVWVFLTVCCALCFNQGAGCLCCHWDCC